LNVRSTIEDHTPLTRNSFAAEFNGAGSSIMHAERFAEHARQILVDEENYLGLFALDLMLSNKKNQYRNDGVTPKANHPLLVFFQFQMFHENDKQHPNRKWKYLPDRPDLDKIVALLHDEGEDHLGCKPEDIKKKMLDFIENLDSYVVQHNQKNPHMLLAHASTEKQQQMYEDIPTILKPFDLLSRKFKGEREHATYYENHVRLLDDARACRVKTVDKACNGATFAYRNRALTTLIPLGLDSIKYRDWVMNQKSKLRDLYFVQPFALKDSFNEDQDSTMFSGFINVAKNKFPESKKFFNVMRRVLDTQLNLYDHDLANEKAGHGSPQLRVRSKKYDEMTFSPSVNLIDILISRLKEVRRIDETKHIRDPKRGLYDIPFAPTQLQAS